MRGFVVVHVKPSEIRVVQKSGGLRHDLIDHIVNFALPFGSGWGNYIGVRSIKLINLDAVNSCISLNTIAPPVSGRKSTVGEMYTLAIVDSAEAIDADIRSDNHWVSELFEQSIRKVKGKRIQGYLRAAIEKRMEGEESDSNPHIYHRILAKFKRGRVAIDIHEFYRNEAQLLAEGYIRALYLMRRGRKRRSLLPTFTTLTLSESEFTEFVGYGVLKQQHQVAIIPQRTSSQTT